MTAAHLSRNPKHVAKSIVIVLAVLGLVFASFTAVAQTIDSQRVADSSIATQAPEGAKKGKRAKKVKKGKKGKRARKGAAKAKTTSMSVDEMKDSAQSMVTRMRDMLETSFGLLEESIARNDVATTSIRNEAITAMKGLVKLSEENLMTLRQKAAERDRDGVEHEYVKISIASAKLSELYAQVRTSGGIDVDIEATDVESSFSIDSEMPVDQETPATFSDSADVIPDEPVFASTYR